VNVRCDILLVLIPMYMYLGQYAFMIVYMYDTRYSTVYNVYKNIHDFRGVLGLVPYFRYTYTYSCVHCVVRH